MKTAFTYLCSALLLLAGCHTDDDAPQIDRGQRVPVRFSSLGLEITPMTRATETALEGGDAISISVVNKSETGTDSLVASGNYADNYRYTYNGTSHEFETESEGIWQYKTLPFDLVYYAVYPYTAQFAPVSTFMVETDQSLDGAYTASDLCIQKLDTKALNVTLEMAHMMSNVEIHVTGDDLDLLPDVSVFLADVMTEAVIDLNSDVDPQHRQMVTATGDYQNTQVKCLETESGATERVFSALIPPQEIAVENKFVKLNITTTDSQQHYFAVGFPRTRSLYSGKRTKIYCQLEQDTNGQITITYAGPEDQPQHPDSRNN